MVAIDVNPHFAVFDVLLRMTECVFRRAGLELGNRFRDALTSFALVVARLFAAVQDDLNFLGHLVGTHERFFHAHQAIGIEAVRSDERDGLVVIQKPIERAFIRGGVFAAVAIQDQRLRRWTEHKLAAVAGWVLAAGDGLTSDGGRRLIRGRGRGRSFMVRLRCRQYGLLRVDWFRLGVFVRL